MGETTVAISSLGLAATLAGALIWVLKFFLPKFLKNMQEHSRALLQQNKSNEYIARALLTRAEADNSLKELIETVAKSSHEQYVFMKKLNGKFEEAIRNKVAGE